MICRHCGAVIDDDSACCKNCGEPQNDGIDGMGANGSESACTEVRKKSNTVLVVAVVAIAAAILAGAAGIFMVGRVVQSMSGGGYIDYSDLSDEDIIYLDTYEWKALEIDDAEKLDVIDRLLEMMYDDGYTDIYDVFPNAQAAYDEIENLISENPSDYEFLYLLLKNKLDASFDRYSDLESDDVDYLDTDDWTDPDFDSDEKLNALVFVLQKLYNNGYTDVYDVFPDAQAAYDEIEDYMSKNSGDYEFINLILIDKLPSSHDYSDLSDHEVYHLDTDDWKDSYFTNGEKLKALNRLLDMIYDDGYTDVHDVYPNAQAAYDEIENYISKNQDNGYFLDSILEDKLSR